LIKLGYKTAAETVKTWLDDVKSSQQTTAQNTPGMCIEITFFLPLVRHAPLFY